MHWWQRHRSTAPQQSSASEHSQLAEYRLRPDSAHTVVQQTGPVPQPTRFLSTDHLSAEAVAAYVDGRLPHNAHCRARAHLNRCQHCSQEIEQQTQARQALRGSGPISMPDDLRHRLDTLAALGPALEAEIRAAPKRRRDRLVQELRRWRRKFTPPTD